MKRLKKIDKIWTGTPSPRFYFHVPIHGIRITVYLGMKISPFIIVLKYQRSELEIGVEQLEKNIGGTDSFQLYINEQNSGIIFCLENKWIASDIDDKTLVDMIGHCIKEICEKAKDFIGKDNIFSLFLN